MDTLDQLHDSKRLYCSLTLVQTSVLRSRDELSRHNDAIVFLHGVHFILCPKQGNKIEGVVVNRVCILGFFLL